MRAAAPRPGRPLAGCRCPRRGAGHTDSGAGQRDRAAEPRDTGARQRDSGAGHKDSGTGLRATVRARIPLGTEGPITLQAEMFADENPYTRRRAGLAPGSGNGAGTGIWARFAP